MRAATGVLAACLLLTASAAFAQDDGYGYRFHADGDSGLSGFAGLRGSLAFTGGSSSNVPASPPTALHASYDTSGGGSFYFGTRLPLGLRLELEALYRYLPFNTVTMGGTGAIAHGQTQMGAPMVNLMWDLPVPDFPFRPFIGAGIGGAYVASSLKDATNTNNYFRSNSWNFAYELMGGMEFPMSQSSRLTAMYRWLNVDNVNGRCGLAGAPTLGCTADLNTQSIDLGLEMDM